MSPESKKLSKLQQISYVKVRQNLIISKCSNLDITLDMCVRFVLLVMITFIDFKITFCNTGSHRASLLFFRQSWPWLLLFLAHQPIGMTCWSLWNYPLSEIVGNIWNFGSVIKHPIHNNACLPHTLHKCHVGNN